MFRSVDFIFLNLIFGIFILVFNKGIYEYNVIVDNDVMLIGVIFIVEDINVIIIVNGKIVLSGVILNYVSLDEGSNVINVKVIDIKNNSNIYVLNVIRRYFKDNVNLSGFLVIDGIMFLIFDLEIYFYSVKVVRSVEKVKVIFIV